MLFHLQPTAYFQPPTHVCQDAAFHSFTTHAFLPSLPLLPCLLRHKRGQFHSKRFVCPEEQRFQRALRTVQNLGDLRIIQLFILVQQHRGPLLFRQLVDRAANHFPPSFFDEELFDVRVLLRNTNRPLI